jgi:hypothetical protein
MQQVACWCRVGHRTKLQCFTHCRHDTPFRSVVVTNRSHSNRALSNVPYIDKHIHTYVPYLHTYKWDEYTGTDLAIRTGVRANTHEHEHREMLTHKFECKKVSRHVKIPETFSIFKRYVCVYLLTRF